MTKQLICNEKRRNANKKKTSFTAYYILVLSIILYFTYNYFFGYSKIGHDYRYMIFIIILPLLSGVIFVGFYRRKDIRITVKAKNKLFIKTLDIFFELLFIVLLSFFTFSFGTRGIWDYFNVRKAKQNNIECFDCIIIKTSIGAGRDGSPKITFIFNDGKETLPINYEEYSKCLKSNLESLKIKLFVRKGIWNYYVVENKIITE